MDDDFARRFLAARDEGLLPHDSYRRKRGHYPEDEVELWFTRPFEYLEQADFESILLAAAKSGALQLAARFRYTCPGAQAHLLMVRYQEAYLLPLTQRYVLRCGSASTLNTVGEPGIIIVHLFSRPDTPPEYSGRRISPDEFAEKVRRFLPRQVDPPRRDN